tara:strand:- start:1067 stop:1912 length:846 start_codon:yes stop_codon:yes gene_type:complete
MSDEQIKRIGTDLSDCSNLSDNDTFESRKNSGIPPINCTDTIINMDNNQINPASRTRSINEPWNYNIKFFLKKIGEKSMGYRWMLEQEAVYYKKVDTFIKISQIVLTAILTILSSGTLILLLVDTGNNESLTAKLIVTLIELFITLILNIINGINQQGNFKSKSKKFLQVSYNFIRIYHTIQQQLIKPIEQRENDHKFVQKKVDEYDNLLIDTLEIRQSIRDAYLIATKDRNIFKPLIVGDIENIDIENIDTDSEIIDKNTDEKNNNNKYKFEIQRFINNF